MEKNHHIPNSPRCWRCLFLAGLSAAELICLLCLLVFAPLGSGADTTGPSNTDPGAESCDSLSRCAQSAEDTCQFQYGARVRVTSVEQSKQGWGCTARCSNGGLVYVTCVVAALDGRLPVSGR